MPRSLIWSAQLGMILRREIRVWVGEFGDWDEKAWKLRGLEVIRENFGVNLEEKVVWGWKGESLVAMEGNY